MAIVVATTLITPITLLRIQKLHSASGFANAVERAAANYVSIGGHANMEETMKKLAIASALVVLSTTGVCAQTPQKSPTKLSQAECDSLWNQANPSNAATISQSQASNYVSDFKAANPDNDGSLDKAEFSKACNMGLVRGSGSTGASPGSSGSGSAN